MLDLKNKLPIELILFSPEILLIALALIYLIRGLFIPAIKVRYVSILFVLVAILASFFTFNKGLLSEVLFSQNILANTSSTLGFHQLLVEQLDFEIFANMLQVNEFTLFARIVLLLLCFAIIWMSSDRALFHSELRVFEFPILIILSTLGMMITVASNHLLILYLGLELMSLALYVLIAMPRSCTITSEAGLKYFILSSVSSAILLFGISLVYAFTGFLDFHSISIAITNSSELNLGILLGLILMLSGIFFKLSAVPFHMWTPDVYQGSPTIVTTLLATSSKVTSIFLMLRLLTGVFSPLNVEWVQIIAYTAAITMLIGSIGALIQTNIKRILAYSSISHMGFVLVGFATCGISDSTAMFDGIKSIIVYTIVYVTMTLGTFGILLMLSKDGKAKEDLSQIAGLSRTHPYLSLALAALMFSMAGVPPLLGFIAKFYIFNVAIQHGLYVLVGFALVASVISAYYYLRIVKVIYLDAPVESNDTIYPIGNVIITGGCVLFNVLYLAFPTKLLFIAESIALVLLLS